MQSEIILLSNVKQDGLAQIVQDQFKLLGISSVKGKRIDADESAIKSNLSASLSQYNVIIIIGGVGNGEDITVKAVAETIGYETVLRDGQTFPKGAEILHNKKGYPSGCAISHGNQCIIILPGNRETIEYMLCYRVSEYIAEFTSEHFYIRTLRADGISKQAAQKAVMDAESFGASAMVFEDGNELAIQVLAHGASNEQAKERNGSAVKNIIAVLGNAVYAIDAENIGQALGQELSKKNLSVAIANEGFRNDLVETYAYTTEYSDHFSGISHGTENFSLPEKLLKKHGKNSDWTAAALAGEVRNAYESGLGIAITADKTRPGEGAHIAVCRDDFVWTEKVNAKSWSELEKIAPEKAAHLARKVASAYPGIYEKSVSLSQAISGNQKFSTVSSQKKKKWYTRFIPMAGDSKGELIRKIIFIVSVLTFIGCMAFLGTKAFDAVGHRSLAANLHDLYDEKKEPVEVPDEWEYLPSLYDLYQENNDLIGYIKIENTNVSYPVVQTVRQGKGGETGQFYLRNDYYGNYSMYGTPFLDYRCDANPDYPTNNLLVYGHNIYNDGQMFSDLLKYRKLKFTKEHPMIQFDTLYGEGQYMIIGVVLTNAYKKDGPIWNYNNFIDGTEEETKDFIKEIARRTLIVTGVDYNTSDTFLTLSTCCYDFKDARFVIIARKLRDGETADSFDFSKAYYSKNPLMPDKWYQALAEKQKAEEDAQFGNAENPEDKGEIKDIYPDFSNMKLTYKVGEKFSLDGLILEVTRVDAQGNEKTETIKDGFGEYNYTFTEAGKQTVTIIYEGQEIEIEVMVEEATPKEATIQSGSVNTSGGTVKYIAGDKFAKSGIVLDLVMSDNTTKQISLADINDSDITGFNSKKAGKQTISVNYEGKTYTFDVSVRTVEKLEVSINNTEYKVGDTIDEKSITVKAVLSDGEKVTLKNGYNVTLPNMGTASDGAEIVVSYTRNDNNQAIKGTTKVVIKAAEQKPEETHTDIPVETGTNHEDPGTTTDPIVPEEQEKTETEENEQPEDNPIPLKVANMSVSNASSNVEKAKSDMISVNGTTISMYEAVCRIVQYEAGNGQPAEHVKAQTVATFSYLKNSGSVTGVGMKALSNVSSRNIGFIEEVIGYELADDSNNKPILATYFTESCGYSADAEWVWGYANRNLKSVRISADNPSGYTYKMKSSEFKNKMGSGFDLTGDPSSWIQILSYEGNTPLVKQVKVGGITVKARALREKYLGNSNLRSVAFDVSYDKSSDTFTFVSYGYGHGVGMSAQASIKYANQGYGWEDILMKFYSNCYVKNYYA